MSTVETPARLLTLPEVAARLAVSRATVYRMVHDGRLPTVQLGGAGASLRVDADELAAWLYGLPSPGSRSGWLPPHAASPHGAPDARAM